MIKQLVAWLTGAEATINKAVVIDLAPYSSVVSLIDDVAKGVISFEQLYNSPQLNAARQALAEQKQRELDAQAVTKAKAGDSTELQERSS